MKRILLLLTGIFFLILSAVNINAQEQPPDQEQERPLDGFYERLYLDEKEAVQLPYVREADILYQKRVWQRIDLREKINQTLYFPTQPTGNRKSLSQVLYDAVIDGEVTAYDGFVDDFSQPLTREQVMDHLEEEVTVERADLPDTTYTVDFDPADVTRIHIKEDWFFDSKRSTLDVRIIGILPLRERIDPETGEFLAYEPLFWIYYPEARDVLVNQEVFNPNNDAARVSFDDMFLRRMFNSYIYKESTASDRSIEDYKSGLDALLKAEQLENEIRHFEHDLWEY